MTHRIALRYKAQYIVSPICGEYNSPKDCAINPKLENKVTFSSLDKPKKKFIFSFSAFDFFIVSIKLIINQTFGRASIQDGMMFEKYF